MNKPEEKNEPLSLCNTQQEYEDYLKQLEQKKKLEKSLNKNDKIGFRNLDIILGN